MIASKITDLIGNTPMLKLKMKNNDWNVFLKLEKFNPGGSMKDRMALNMIEEAEKREAKRKERKPCDIKERFTGRPVRRTASSCR